MSDSSITVDEAVSAIRSDYYKDVNQTAESFLVAFRKGELSSDATDALEEWIDGDARIIYTFQAKLGLLVSENEDAYEEETGETTSDVSVAMHYAFRADIVDYLNRNHGDWEDAAEDDAYEEDDSPDCVAP